LLDSLLQENKMSESSDLNTKYQKLATEYAKLRSQVVVLKKGVLDEQDKSTNLSEQLHDRETTLRKHESEMEGVLFRNQQLSKRVNVLQDEIDNLQTKSKPKWRSSNNDEKDRADRVINEELMGKISENARLHATLDDIEKQYENTILSLQTRVQDLESEKSLMGAEKKNQQLEVAESVSHLTKENDDLRARVTLLERDLALKGKQNENLEVQVNILAEKNRNLENIERKDFSHQFLFVDPLLSKLQEEKDRELSSSNQRLSEALVRLEDVERDREHWKLEHQLSQIKLQKVHNSGDKILDQDEFIHREVEMKKAFQKRLGELVGERINSDSKTTSYFLECEALAFKVEELEEQFTQASGELNEKRDMLDRGEEEIRTMQLNYEEQLSVMSDHLAEMNSKLATQEDTIISLRQVPDPSEGKKKKK